MLARRLTLLTLVALVWPVTAHALTFEITRELGTPEHHYLNSPPFTSATDAVPFPAAPNVQFAISSYSAVRLRLVAPVGKKFVCTRAVYLSWPGDLNLIPVGSSNSGTLHVCPTSWSINTLAGTAPVSNIEGFKTDGDWLKIRATGTSASSANFEFTEIVLEWDVTAFSGSLHTYAMSDAGGWISGPEVDLYQTLSSGAPDPGPAVSLQDIVAPCTSNGVTWPVCGAPVAVKPGGQVEPFPAADGSGGAWVSYTHFASIATGNYDVWLNHLDANGNPAVGWPADGIPLCELAQDQVESRVVADGSGGAFVAWDDTRNDPGNFNDDVYLQRITASGARAPGWPANGVNVHTITPTADELLTGLVGDGAGGAFVLWSDVRLNRFTGSGTIHPSWPANGLLIGTGGSQLLADGVGGAYVCWNTGTDLRIVRVTPLGAIASGWAAAGLVVGTGAGSFAIDLGLNGGHVNVAWIVPATGLVRASRVTSGGSVAPGWPVDVRFTTDPKSYLTVANGGTSGDVVMAWREDLPDPAGFQVVSQRLTPTGAVAPGWPANGWQVIPDGRELRAIPDCVGGTTLAFWSGGIRAIRFTQAGTLAPGWPSGGVLLCGGSFSLVLPHVTWVSSDGTGGVITAVSRIQPGSGNAFDRADIHAQCVRGDGSADEGYAGGTPVGSNVKVQVGPAAVTFASVTAAGETWLEIADSGPPPPWGLQIVPSSPPVYYDVTTVAQYQGPVQVCITYDPATVQGPESGLQLLHYDATAQPPAWVNVTTSLDQVANVICGSTPSLSPFIVVEADPTDVSGKLPLAHCLYANIPNPFNPTTTIRYDLPVRGHVRLEVLDVTGRLVRTLVNASVEAGRHEAEWPGRDEDGRRVTSGVYFYRLEAGSFVATRRCVLLK